jgi:hypothetical protein
LPFQQKLHVRVSEITAHSAEHAVKPADLAGWRVSDLSIGYLVADAVVGNTLTVAVGFTNLTEFDVTLQFPTSQRVGLTVMDQAGHAIYKPPQPTGPPVTETIKATEGAYWTDKLILDPKIFKHGTKYVLNGVLNCNLSGSASIVLTLP